MRVIAILLAIQAAVLAAPSEIIQESNPSKPNEYEQLLDITEDSSIEKQRQKRWYNYYGYGFPPVSPVVYPTIKRDNVATTANYGNQEDHLSQIYRRLQEITAYVKQPNYAPPPTIPIFFPVIYIPLFDCNCPPAQEQPTQPINATMPGVVENRFDDTRQNWGFVVNSTEPNLNDPDYVDDSIRPISFATVRPSVPTSRPPPSVEHGSSQAGAGDEQIVTEQPTPQQPEQNSQGREPPSTSAPFAPPQAQVSPSPCDVAILSCCHQLQVTYECFTSQGCQNPTEFGNPCSVETIKTVIGRFQIYYGQRT